MKNSIQILTTTNIDHFSDAGDKFEAGINKEKIKTRLSLIYFLAVFASLILLFV